MIALLFSVLLLASDAPATSSQDSAPASRVDQTPKKQRKVCKVDEEDTFSKIRRRVCKMEDVPPSGGASPSDAS
jgi:invasion protein IalB